MSMWERLRGLGGGEKDGTEEWERLLGLGGEGKDGTEERLRTGREDGRESEVVFRL